MTFWSWWVGRVCTRASNPRESGSLLQSLVKDWDDRSPLTTGGDHQVHAWDGAQAEMCWNLTESITYRHSVPAWEQHSPLLCQCIHGWPTVERTMLSTAKVKPKYYKRFIDDIFLIVNCNKTQLAEFIKHMNSQNASIQFTHEYSKNEIIFLDVTLYLDRNRL